MRRLGWGETEPADPSQPKSRCCSPALKESQDRNKDPPFAFGSQLPRAEANVKAFDENPGFAGLWCCSTEEQNVVQMSKGPPNQEAFEKLLTWLDPDRDRAGGKYNKIQSKLIGTFACFGCDAEDLADKTINVVISKSDWLIENYIGDPALYFYGVAKKIYQERLRKKPAPIIHPFGPCPDKKDEQMHHCLEESLQELTLSDRVLVLEYHEGRKQQKIKNRAKLAQDLGISRNALRIKVHRIHADLRRRVERCLKALPPD